MASSVTTIATTNVLATTAAVLLSGPTKIVAANMAAADVVTIYEETGTEGNYQQVLQTEVRKVCLKSTFPSIIFEGYGKYKFLLGPDTNVNLVVGYAA
jgi:hypothetical protein